MAWTWGAIVLYVKFFALWGKFKFSGNEIDRIRLAKYKNSGHNASMQGWN